MNEPQYGRRLAIILSTPFRVIHDWLENKCFDSFDYETNELRATPALLFYAKLEFFFERWWALTYVILARNGSDYTFWFAVKACICLVLNLRQDTDHRENSYEFNYGPEVAFWCRGDSLKRWNRYPSTWKFIQIGEGWRQWWFEIGHDSDDSGCM